MRSGLPLGQAEQFFRREGVPFTKALVVSNVVTLFMSVLGMNDLLNLFVFHSSSALMAPWRLVSFPWVNRDPLGVLFGCLWLWSLGGSLERACGTRRFAGFFVLQTAIIGLALLLASRMISFPLRMDGLWLPLSGVTVAFCMINWDEQMSFWFIPMRSQYLMYIVVGLTFVLMAQMHPLVGLFALTGPAFGYAYLRWLRGLWAREPKTVGWRGRLIEIEPPPPPAGGRGWNPINTFMRWKRKRDFQRLMRKSGFDDRRRG